MFDEISKKTIENSLHIRKQCGLEMRSMFQCQFLKLIHILMVSQVQYLNFMGTLINHMIMTIMQYNYGYQWQCCSIGDYSTKKINN